MKNFNLLLATTAILSTAVAMNVKATNPTDIMDASIDIVVARDFEVTLDMDFGRWVVPSNKASVKFTMSESGFVTTTDTSVTNITNGSYGLTVGAPCDILEFPLSVSLDNTPRDTATATLSGINAYDVADGLYSCYIYADSLVIADTGEGGISSGQYFGGFTITAVLDPANP